MGVTSKFCRLRMIRVDVAETRVIEGLPNG